MRAACLPSADPGDGRQWCPGCQRWKFLVIHSCPGVPQREVIVVSEEENACARPVRT